MGKEKFIAIRDIKAGENSLIKIYGLKDQALEFHLSFFSKSFIKLQEKH